MKLIELSDPNKALRDLMRRIIYVKGNCGATEDLYPTVGNVRDAAVTLFEIADGQREVKDTDALRDVLFNVLIITGDDDATFPDGLDDDCDVRITPANLHAAAAVLMEIADCHDAVA